MLVQVFREGRYMIARDVETNEDVTNLISQSLRRKALLKNLYISKHSSLGWILTKQQVPITTTSFMDVELKSKFNYITCPKDLIISPLKWKFLLRSVYRGENIMMTGDAGAGKTTVAQTIPELLNRPFFYFNLGATSDPRSTLIGNTHFDKGTFFTESYFVKAIQTVNAVILLDEITAMHQDAEKILITVLDKKQRYLRLDEHPDTPTIKVAKGVCFIATANIGLAFTHTRKMSRATLNRFFVLEMDSLTKEEEERLITLRYPNLKAGLVKTVAEIVIETRKEAEKEDGKLEFGLSTRQSLEIAGLLDDDFTLEEVAQIAIYPFFSKDGGADSERTFVKQQIQKYIVNPSTNIPGYVNQPLFTNGEMK